MARLVSLLGLLLMSSVPALAQVQRTHWGVAGGFTPKWETHETFKQFFDADSATFEGTDIRLGFVRGSIVGGDWGVSFVRRSVSDRSNVSRLTGECAGCGQFFTATDARMTGVEVNKFVPFGTIKDRVQIGMNFAGGVAQLKGSVRAVSVSPAGTTAQDVEAKELFAPWGYQPNVVPLGKIEIAVAAILAPDLKLRVGGGFDFPGYNRINASLVYLIGAR